MPQEIQKEKTFKSFDDFTNLYEVQKTLRFELKSVGKTAELIKQNKVLQTDKQIDDNYHDIKYYFDLLHKKFIREALSGATLDYIPYSQSFLALDKNDKTTQDNFKKEEESLRKRLVEIFNKKANEWKERFNKTVELKKNDINILFEKDNFEILKIEFPEKPKDDPKAPDIKYIDKKDGQEKNLFESFKGFTTYLTNFNHSRRNFYSEKDQNTAVANRAINENLRRFCDNKKQFEDKKWRNEYEKIEPTAEEKDIFELNYYNSCLTQGGIDQYNSIVGRRAKDESQKGLNQRINEYRQNNKKLTEKLPLFKPLYNQIMGGKEKAGRDIEITSDSNVFDVLKQFITHNDAKIKQARELFYDFLENGASYELDKIYLKKLGVNTIAGKFFIDRQYFEDALPHKKTKSEEEKLKLDDFISIKDIKNALLGRREELPKGYKYKSGESISATSENLFKDIYKMEFVDGDNWQTFLNVWKKEFNDLLNDTSENNFNDNESYEYKKRELEKEIIVKGKINKDRVVRQEKMSDKNVDITETSLIKMYADSALKIYQMMKYFALEKGKKKVENLATDNDFYNKFEKYYNDCQVVAYFNEFRNYLTKKDFLGRLLFPVFGEQDSREHKNPLSKRKTDGAEKIKLNFGCGNLLSGWAQDYDKSYGALLFQNNGKYYLGVIKNKIDKDEVKKLKVVVGSKNLGKRLVYDYQKPDNKNIPRLFIRSTGDKFSPAVHELKLPIQSVIDIYDKGLFKVDKKNPEAHKKYLAQLIDYFKIGLERHPSYENFSLQWKESVKYENIADFYRDVIDSCYKISYEDVNFNYLKNDLVSAGKIYLFEIYNKDFGNIKENSNLNIYTYLFLELLNPENIKVLKLMGGGEIFFRPKVENLPNYQKNGKDLRFTDKRDNYKEKDVLQHRRYAEDKYFLHFPISIVGRNLNSYLINKTINEYLFSKFKENEEGEVKIIGIDRGEKNLAYYSVIDSKGIIIDSNSFNKIDMLDKDGKIMKTVDYAKIIKERAGSRDEARKNWKTIENIKELKNGYVSQVVRKICDLILKYDAIVIFEDLNFGFKLKRSALDFPVYQKLELALIKKLNYLVNKNTKREEAGHCLRAYQLAPMVANPQDIGKQTGIVFYTQASYTSKTCPKCGFRKNNNKFKYFESIKKAQDWLGKLEKFEYDEKEKGFTIKYNLDDFLSDDEKSKSKKEKLNELFCKIPIKKEFIVYSNVIRYRWHNKLTAKAKGLNVGETKYIEEGKGIVKKYNITECLRGLFDKNRVSYKEDLLNFVVSKDNDLPVEFYRDLFYYLNLIFEIRNSVSGAGIDYIQCPRCGFHSDNPPKELEQIKDADANGAYNIARKGILILNKIKQFNENKKELKQIKSNDLFINIDEWDKFAQKDWQEK